MADDFIAVDITGLQDLGERFKKLPPAMQEEGMKEVNTYMLNVLRQYPAEKRIKRSAAYPEVNGWFSDKQRRWFFAALRSGELDLPYSRTQELGKAWKVVGNEAAKSIIANEAPAAPYVMGDTEQSRMSKMIGWKKISDIVKERMPRILERFDVGVKNAVKKLRLDK
jgi:hypothetical protein